MPVGHKRPWAPGMAPGNNNPGNGSKDTARPEGRTPNEEHACECRTRGSQDTGRQAASGTQGPQNYGIQ
jgi:hypothetical protein